MTRHFLVRAAIAFGLVLVPAFAAAEDRPRPQASNAALFPNGTYEDHFVRLRLSRVHFEKEAQQLSRKMSSSGALNYNADWEARQSGEKSIAAQRHAFALVAAGVGGNNTSLTDRGLRAIEWGFGRQKPNGSFEETDVFNNICLFTDAAARSVILIRGSQSTPEEFKKRARALVPKLHLSAQWLAANLAGLNRKFTHRLFATGTALQEVAFLTKDTTLAGIARDLMNSGLSQQRHDGVFPERDGSDTEYHSFSIELVTRYASLETDADFRRTLMTAAKKGADWLIGKIGPDGIIDYSANTRTGACGRRHLNRQGQPKNVGYKNIPVRLTYYSNFWNDWGNVSKVIADVERRDEKFSIVCP